VLGWLQRDPLGYVDGANLYEYCGSMPLISLDPPGLWHNPVLNVLNKELRGLEGAIRDAFKKLNDAADAATKAGLKAIAAGSCVTEKGAGAVSDVLPPGTPPMQIPTLPYIWNPPIDVPVDKIGTAAEGISQAARSLGDWADEKLREMEEEDEWP